MNASRKKPNTPELFGIPVSIAVSVLYLAFGLLWIFFSDWVASSLSASAKELHLLSSLKGWGFVLVTAGGLYALLRLAEKREQKAHKELERELLQFSWLLEKEKGKSQASVPAEYEDITALNKNGLILRTVGKPMLQNMATDIMALLDTSLAVYEKTGDYAFGTFVSAWCGTQDNASRRLCQTDDNAEALACGKWLCHESCWFISKEAIDSGKAVDRACSGGLRIYAVPIRAGDEIIGVISVGYGTPPDNPDRLTALAETYQLSAETLQRTQQAYLPRPPFIIETAKKHLHSIAQLIGQTVDHQRNQEILQLNEEKYRALFEYAPLPYQSLNEDGYFIDVNPAWLRHLGYSRDEVIGQPFSSFLHPDVVPHFETNFPAFKKRGYVRDVQFRIRHKNGDYRFIEFEGRIGHWPDGSFRQTYCVFQDITERKKAETQLKKHSMELEEFNKMAVGRELRMVELKQEINALCRELDREEPY